MLASWRRSGLVKRLWKVRQRHEATSKDENIQDLEIRSALNTLLKRLTESQLESLVLSVESKGGELTSCVPLPKTIMVKLGKRTFDSLTFINGVFRWPQLLRDDIIKDKKPSDSDTELERLTWCSFDEETDSGSSCCNPHHYTQVVTPKIMPPLSMLSIADRKDETDSGSIVSTETGGTPSYQQPLSGDSLTPNGRHRNYWCVIAYWEHKRRIGRLYTVKQPSVNVFQTLPHGDGVSLSSLSQADAPETDNVKRTREKIGLGVLLSKRHNEVWIYNRSDYPIFVNSPTLDNPCAKTFSVHKLPSGHSMKVFDYTEAEILQRNRDRPLEDGPYDPSAIRISFAKGWGGSYSRQFITSCPCWLEILLRGGSSTSS